jgi:hypothetical protein
LALFQLWNPVDITQIEVKITLAAEIGQVLARHPVCDSILGKVTPVIFQAVWAQQVLQISNSITWISSQIITGTWPSVIFKEDHFMTKTPEADEILEVVPTVAP